MELENARAEFFVEKDRSVTIMFYDAELKPVPAGDRTVAAIAGADQDKVKIAFEKKGDVLVSTQPLPDDDGYTVVVQLRATLDASPKNFWIVLNMEIWGECLLAEYACICGY